MDQPKVTPKDFFLWAGAMVAAYWSVIAFIFLFFNYIDYAFPDPLSSYASDPYLSGVGYEMASIVVLFPIYLVLMYFIRRGIVEQPLRKELWVRRWALILTLFVAGVTIAVDFIQLLTRFFNGQSLTTAFLMKALLIFLVAAAVFMHFIADYWGYWDLYPQRNRSVGVGAVALAIVAIASGFFILGTPAQARQYRMDEQRVADLQQLQSQLLNYWRQNARLPSSLADLNGAMTGYSIPSDPETNAQYEYKQLGTASFELCATFDAQTQPNAVTPAMLTMPAPAATTDLSSVTWYHAPGRTCFTRVIDPTRYPPLSTKPVSG